MYHKLFFQACFHNYFASLQRWKVIYSNAVKKKNFLAFFFPGPEKKKAFFEERKSLVLSLSFIEHHLAEFVTLHQFLAFFPLGTDFQLRTEEKYIIAGNTYFSLSLTVFFFFS